MSTGKTSPIPQARQISPQTLTKVRMHLGIRIPLRDGIHLNANVYLPQDPPAESAPAIFTLTPYIAQTYHEHALYFAANGYPFLAVDVRGRGDSEGVFQPFIQEAEDGYDVVEWLAQQPYCNGQVTMWGGSYGGYDQWVTAKKHPPHLATIVPVAAPYFGVDVWMRSNITYTYLMRWLTSVTGRSAKDKLFWNGEAMWTAKFREWFESGKPFKELDSLLGNPSPTFQEWIAHPCVDAFWDRYNLTSQDYAQLSIPILTITGIYDSDQPGALMNYRQYMQHTSEAGRERHYLVIGPWHHAGTRVPEKRFAGVTFGDACMVDLAQLHLQWYAWTMQGGPKPAFLRKPVAYYVTGAERWRYADSLDGITARSQILYLSSAGNASQIFGSGLLATESGDGPADLYRYDPRDTSIAEIESALSDPICLRPTFPTENLTDQTVVFGKEGKQLVYHSAPFERDTEISGFFKLEAWISIDQPDTDFGVSIYEISADGSSMFLTWDLMRARYRESLRAEKLVRTTEPLRYDFERFTFVSRLVKRGSRLRLVIGPLNSIHFQKNHNSGGVVAEETVNDARTVTVRLFHESSYPSALHVPIAHPE